MRKMSKTLVGLSTATTVVFSLAMAGSAHADYAPGPGDVVGAGSDTLQYLGDFLADGDVGGDAGFNSGAPTNRLVSIDATADANARLAYANGSTNAVIKTLNPTVVDRAGTFPVARPNGSGAGADALAAQALHPTLQNDPNVNFARMSSKPSAAQEAAVPGGQMHVVQVATENLGLAVSSTSTNMPAAGLSALELVGIYQCTTTHWNALPGNSGGSANTIIPIIPQSGSGTRNTFLADLQVANGGTAITLGSCVVVSEENDPTAIGAQSSPADAIEPMSQSRLNLWNGTSGNGGIGFFHNPAGLTGKSGLGVLLAPGAVMAPLSGNAGDGNPAYHNNRSLYIVFNQSHCSDPAWQPGGTQNWVEALFSNCGHSALPTPYAQTAFGGTTLFAAAGATAGGTNYSDLGVNPF
jgi:ABC-type phosphate transport system substrate-binding protein